jgi:serine protease Do
VIVEQGGKFYVVTNRHVIKDAEIGRIKVRLSDGREVGPQKTWADAETDVAVMSLSGTDYSAARLGDSDRLEIGDFVLAIGSPFGLSHSMTLGIVSAKDRRNLALGDERLKYQDFIQTDAAINPGNSGGPLLNLRGEVIGINTAIATNSGKNEGIGFAIPTSMVDVVVKQLVENGTVQRAHLGVSLDDKFGPAQAARIGLLRPEGARITAVEPKSPAEVAAIQVGDVILSYNGKHVDDESHLMNLVSLTPIGADVAVVVYRGKQEIAIRVKVGDKANSLWSQKRNNGRP